MRCVTAFIGLSFVMFVSISSISRAQEPGQNGPVVVPGTLQEIALKFPIAERLGIKWDSATPADVGRYMGFLAGIEVVAKTIAGKEDHSSPTFEDYVAAISAQCMFPPNKPPFVEKYWPQIYPAFYSAITRNKLREAVGPQAVSISKTLQENGLDEFSKYFTKYLPTEETQYFQKIFDPTKLK